VPAVPTAPPIAAPPPGGLPSTAQVTAWGDGVGAEMEAGLIALLKILGWVAVGVGALGLILQHTHGLRRFGYPLMITACIGLAGDLALLTAATHLISGGLSWAASSPTPGGR
jgi:hypothetical protein